MRSKNRVAIENAGGGNAGWKWTTFPRSLL